MKLYMMSERLAYGIMIPIEVIGIILVGIDFYNRIFDLSGVSKFGVLLMLLGSFIFFYHLYTILNEKPNPSEVSS